MDPIERGGEFIGTQHTTWLRFADELGLALKPVTSGQQIFCYQTHAVDSVAKARLQAISRRFELEITALAAGVDAIQPWKSPGANHLDALSVEEWAHQKGIPDKREKWVAHHHIGAFVEGICAVPARDYSLLAQLAVVEGGGGAAYWKESDTWRCAEGNDALITGLAVRLGPHHISTSAKVTAIDFGDSPTVDVEAPSGGTTKIATDFIVVTAPAHLTNKINFSPNFPLDTLPQMAHATKCIRRLTFKALRVPTTYLHFSPQGFHSSNWTVSDVQGQIYALTDFITGRQSETFSSTSCEVTDWQSDPFSLGAYPAPRPNEVTRLGPQLHREHGPLQFAGDFHYGFGGYMEGALRSGLRAADNIVARI